ncbi:MAG: hypothetical protein K1X81_03775 [Bacteroidia bacterium]|nr:hypothetical protein [Bacteroidia bacterium]
MKKTSYAFIFLCISCTLTSCNFLWGSKQDDTVDDIFKQGAIDPNLVPQNVGYVPVLPFFQGFVNPTDVYVGYDEMIYVIDDFGVHVLDQKGTSYVTIPIQGATDIIQDRRLHTYIAGRINVIRGGNQYNLPAVFHLIHTGSTNYQIIDTLIHPDCDVSRASTGFRGAEDEQVKFTGLATLHDNTLFVSRTGPKNDITSFSRPDNAILVYDADGNNTSYFAGLSPGSSGLRSSMGISAIASQAAPPQRTVGISTSRDVLITLNDPSTALEFRVLALNYFEDPDLGPSYRESANLLDFDTTKAKRFLYEPFRFKSPEDVYIAPDALQYSFVVDSGTDSFYQFTNKGYEGVNAPATYKDRRQIIASFGGFGSGPFQFKNPSGVCYFKRVVYVADKGNGRICRFKLSTDIE